MNRPSEHSVLEMPLEVGDSSVGSMTVPDPLEHSGVRVHADLLSANLSMIHSDESRNGRNGPGDHLCEDSMIQDIRTEVKRPSQEDGEVIVVGGVGSIAPWFLTGWAEEVEIYD